MKTTLLILALVLTACGREESRPAGGPATGAIITCFGVVNGAIAQVPCPVPIATAH